MKTTKYYLIHGDLYENIGRKHNVLKCIASTREGKKGVFIFNPDLNKPWVIAIDNKDDALYWMRQDAYYDNLKLYVWE